MDYLPMSAPYRLLSRGPTCSCSVSAAGRECTRRFTTTRRHVAVVESNPDLLHMLRDVKFFRAYTGDFLADQAGKARQNRGSGVRGLHGQAVRSRRNRIGGFGGAFSGGWVFGRGELHLYGPGHQGIPEMSSPGDAFNHCLGHAQSTEERPQAAFDDCPGDAGIRHHRP